MVGNYKQIPPADLEEAKKNPAFLKSIAYPEKDSETNIKKLSIDKASDGLHFLLTGVKKRIEGSSFSNAIYGHKAISNDPAHDFAYGPPAYLTPQEVKNGYEAISKIPKDDLKKRFDPQAMQKADIYPWIWEKDSSLEYLMFNFDALIAYFKDASDKGNAMLIWLD